jgi:prepilin-type N-terminal cleavage/methylation domain-containing protein
MTPVFRRHHASSEAGFTLIEALVAMVILSFGLIAVTNLFLVGGTSNKAANHGTGATAQAVEVMERLKAIPFTTLMAATGGNLDSNTGSVTNCTEPTTANCVIAGNFNMQRVIAGVGRMQVRWRIVAPGAGGTDTLYIAVRAESTAPIVGGARSRADMTTFRACTLTGCPF